MSAKRLIIKLIVMRVVAKLLRRGKKPFKG